MSRDLALPMPPESTTTPEVALAQPPIALVVMTRELRANLRTFLAWSIPLAGMLALVCALQPSLANGPLGAKLLKLGIGTIGRRDRHRTEMDALEGGDKSGLLSLSASPWGEALDPYPMRVPMPPSTRSTSPVMNWLSSEARNRAA